MNTPLLAHDQTWWNKKRLYAMEQECFPGMLACVWTGTRENLLVPIPLFEGRGWLAQTRLEALSQGAEVCSFNNNWYIVWPMPEVTQDEMDAAEVAAYDILDRASF